MVERSIDPDGPFDELAALLRRGPSDVLEETPPVSLWAAIEAEIEAEGESGPAIGAATDEIAMTRARRRRLWVATAVATAAAVVLVGIPVGLSLRRSTSTPDETAQLAALADFTGSGQAHLEGHDLVVRVDGLSPVQGEFYELWLLDVEGGHVDDLVSLGTIDSGGTFHIADGIDLSKFSVVDISIEPDDGNPAHSGDSILRGQLA